MKQFNVKMTPKEALSNCVYLNDSYSKYYDEITQYLEIISNEPSLNGKKRIISKIKFSKAIGIDSIGLNTFHRKYLYVSSRDHVEVNEIKNIDLLTEIELEVALRSKSIRGAEFQVEDLTHVFYNNFKDHVFGDDQQVIADVKGIRLIFTVSRIELLGNQEENLNNLNKIPLGLLNSQTNIIFKKSLNENILIKGTETSTRSSLFSKDFKFSELGIGGLDKEFQEILRRAFTSRVYPPKIAKKLGMKHVKGIILHGPPGTGKTLIARQISKMLNVKEIKVVNGPEILNKYIGESEKKIRELFSEAEAEQTLRGDDSDLHIIIFDELDAICRKRGSGSQGSTGVGDSIVNQLLSKFQGVNELNNILVIGMTNRLDMIDDALLRPGRFEIHLEINLPDEYGRYQIFKIHTAKMREFNYLDDNVDLKKLAAITKNYSGAEIEGLIRSATSFAMSRKVDVFNPSKIDDPEDICITKKDFEMALHEIKPAFGISESTIDNRIRNGFIKFSFTFVNVYNECKMYLKQINCSEKSSLLSILIEGDYGCGKTALACKIAKDSEFPYVKILSPDELVGMSESMKIERIGKIFQDAYKSPNSIVILDNIERIIDFVRIGPRFSNSILQSLFVYLNRQPEHVERKLLIIATTSSPDVLEDMDLTRSFDARIRVPNVYGENQLRYVLKEYDIEDEYIENIIATIDLNREYPIKKLIMALESANHGEDETFPKRFINALASQP